MAPDLPIPKQTGEAPVDIRPLFVGLPAVRQHPSAVLKAVARLGVRACGAGSGAPASPDPVGP